jgi:hypothetical protein
MGASLPPAIGRLTLAVMKHEHLPEAAELAVWLTTDPEATKLYTTSSCSHAPPLC